MTVIRFRPGRFDPPVVRVLIDPITQSYPPDDTIRLQDDPPPPEPQPLPVVADLPPSISAPLGSDVVDVDVPSDDAPNWAWRFTEVYDRSTIVSVRHVPASTEPLEYDELVVLDDYTLQPDPADVPIWRNVVDQVVVLQAVTVQAAQSAIGSAQAAGGAAATAAEQANAAAAAAAVARRIEVTTVTWDPVPIAAGGFTSALVNWADTEFGLMIGVAPMTDVGNGIQVTGVVQSAGRVRLTIRNLTGAAVDLPSTTFRVYRIQVPV